MYYPESPALQLKYDALIFLPQLWDLSISTSTKICVSLLGQLIMPSLHALQLNISDYDTSQETILGGLISSFTFSRPPLETLFIEGAVFQCEEFRDLLHILPDLTTMTLNSCDVGDALGALVPDVCPKLVTLDLTGSLLWYPGGSQMDYEQDIIDIICSRARSRLSEDPEERTQRCLCYISLPRFPEGFDFSDVVLKKIRRLGNEYDISIVQGP